MPSDARGDIFWNIHWPCLSLNWSQYLLLLLVPAEDAGAQSTYWMKKNSFFHHVGVSVCAQKSCWLREINVLRCVERKNWWWWWSHAPVCVWGKECVLLCCMAESKHVPILRFRHALKSLKLRCSLGSNCEPNSSYFPHIDVLEAKEREREILNSILRLPARLGCVYHLCGLWNSTHSPNLD